MAVRFLLGAPAIVRLRPISQLVTHQLPRRYCSVDDSLREALARVAERVRQNDSGATVSAAEIPGVRTAGPKMVLRFTCTHKPCEAESTEEERTTTRLISKHSYERGALKLRARNPCISP